MDTPSRPEPLYGNEGDVDKLSSATQLISLEVGASDASQSKPIITPIYHSSTYYTKKCKDFVSQVKDGYIYQRMVTPNFEELSMIISKIEHGVGTVDFPSGMGAIFNTLMCFLHPGDHIVVSAPVYSGTSFALRNLMPQFNIEVSYVDASRDVELYRSATKPNTKMYFAESICNPMMWYVDIEKLAVIGREQNVLTVVDGTFSTPINQTPLDYGIDMVMHSCTKYMGGHSDLLAGCTTVNNIDHYRKLKAWQTFTGVSQSAHNSVSLLRSLRTLHVRMKTHNENAMEVAKFLEKHPKVKKVYYLGLPSHPQHELASRTMKGFGGMMSFEMHSERESIIFAESTRIFKLAVSLGGAESLIEHVTSMTHCKKFTTDEETKHIPDSLIRLSVGIEDVKDQVADLEQAFKQVETTLQNES